MKRKTIGPKSAKFFEALFEKNRRFFDIEMAAKITNANLATTRVFLNDLITRGLILRIKPGKFYVIPYDRDAETYMPNWHLIAKHLVSGGNYIGYYSALEIYELITQPSLIEQVVVNQTLTKSEFKVRDIQFKLIYHNSKHFFGFENIWIDDYHQVKVSDLEKTFIDCIFKPEYAGGIIEITKAIHKAKERIDWAKLKRYLSRFDSKAVNKRLGFILELLEIQPKIQEYLLRHIGKSHTLLDPTVSEKGVFVSKWRLYANISRENLLYCEMAPILYT
jgi:predicted transcriptional regulator of viral defense system